MQIVPQIWSPDSKPSVFFLVCTLVFGMSRRPLPKELSVQVGLCGNDGLAMEQKHKQLWKSSVKSENQSVFLYTTQLKLFFSFTKKLKINLKKK